MKLYVIIKYIPWDTKVDVFQAGMIDAKIVYSYGQYARMDFNGFEFHPYRKITGKNQIKQIADFTSLYPWLCKSLENTFGVTHPFHADGLYDAIKNNVSLEIFRIKNKMEPNVPNSPVDPKNINIWVNNKSILMGYDSVKEVNGDE